MNKTLLKLAYRNIKKYKKHYMIVSIIIFIISIIFMSYPIYRNNHYHALKQYSINQYGQWYYMGNILYDNENPINDVTELNKYINDNISLDNYKVEYEYIQGSYDNYTIAKYNQSLFDLIHTTLKEGTYPKKENEIIISETLAQDKQFKINQSIQLNIDDKVKTYKIVGIITNPQSEYFSDIYTNIPNYTSVKLISNTDINIIFSFEETREFIFDDYIINPHGYDVINRDKTNADYYDINSIGVQTVVIFIEAIFLSSLAFIALTSTSLKRREKDFALLRGIGMTTKQMMCVVLEELLFTSFISIILGIITSFMITYYIALYDAKTLVFYYSINIGQVILYTLVLIAIVMLSCLYPIYSSASNALTGSFDGKKFKKIDIRYKKLKKITLNTIAIREMKANKKITLSLLLILCLITSYLTLSSNNTINNNMYFQSFHYIEASYDLDTTVDYSNALQSINDMTYSCEYSLSKTLCGEIGMTYHDQDVYLTACKVFNDEDFNNCIIDGRIPSNDNEILISQYFDTLYDTNENIIGRLKIGDTLNYFNDTYTIVGIVYTNETVKNEYNIEMNLDYLPICDLYVNKDFTLDTSNQYNVRFYYNNLKEKNNIISYLSLHNMNTYNDSDNGIVNENDLINNVNPIIYIIFFSICLLFTYFLNLNYIQNNKNDYALLRLIGMTKKDIMIKQLYKAIWITALTLIIETLLFITIEHTSVMLIFTIIALVFISSIIIYCLPIISLFSELPIEIKNIKE
jgi:ABC-type lipoprotein release transport system permease subunit